jgi:flavin-dependent dehydrogenase
MKTDVAIIGGGPGGSSAAMFLAKKGIRAAIVEKMTFPRYHIGESMTGECGGLVRELGLEHMMVARRDPVKHGVKVYGPQGKSSFYVPVMARTPDQQLTPAITWQVRRSTFDQMMLNEAASRGADVVHGEVVDVLRGEDCVRGLRVRMPDGRNQDIESQVVIDASGQGTVLAHKGVTSPKERGRYDRQVAIFSQVAGAVRDPGKERDNTIILYKKRFHWAWFIPIDDEITSIGVVVPNEYFMSQKESKHDFLVRELNELHPELSRRTPDKRLVEEARAIPNYSYHIRRFTGKGFICIGDAHRFIDPIFSFGLYFTMREANFAAQAVADYFAGAGRDDSNPFAEHQQKCEGGMDVIQEMMDAFWDHPFPFVVLVNIRHVEGCIDTFAGRVYMDKPSPTLLALRAINALPKCCKTGAEAIGCG